MYLFANFDTSPFLHLAIFASHLLSASPFSDTCAQAYSIYFCFILFLTLHRYVGKKAEEGEKYTRTARAGGDVPSSRCIHASAKREMQTSFRYFAHKTHQHCFRHSVMRTYCDHLPMFGSTLCSFYRIELERTLGTSSHLRGKKQSTSPQMLTKKGTIRRRLTQRDFCHFPLIV
ncbi:hypothetical protein POVWA2_059440 [Plasmodium ovale wallikeri]|uniref:Uncharacterized protein n=1 Tax=Plasmodium ovale wallikeri TaxID=864142 RepID=A0A1A9A1L9_PLAOA|nr:hypothetical protein POVWA2_059440 [Plasmodium ovale wallikeri]